MGEFVGDARRAFAAWRSAPLLPVFSVSVALALQASQAVAQTNIPEPRIGLLASLAWVGVLLFTAGFVGTERLWYAATFRGEPVRLRALWRTSWGFAPRYAWLGLLVWWPFLLLGFGLVAATAQGAPGAFAGFLVGTYAFLVVSDVLLTFATPALAYTTSDAAEALRIGVGMIRRHWPGTVLYALVPPLAALVVARAYAPEFGLPVAFLVAAASTLLNLLLKGATAAYYLRHAPRPVELDLVVRPLRDPGAHAGRSATGAPDGQTDG